jgi:environmental stress-induced protein Ves
MLKPVDYRRMRWKNAGGWTTEIAVSPPDSGLNGKPFDWRVSLAEVESEGEFSAFPGYDRTILLAAGAGMQLSFDAAPPQRLAERYRPFSFKGEWRSHCRLLNGPVRDFNVMTARAGWRHRCEIIRNTVFTAPVAPEIQALIGYCFQGEAGVQMAGKREFALKSGETLYASAPWRQQRLQLTALGGIRVGGSYFRTLASSR